MARKHLEEREPHLPRLNDVCSVTAKDNRTPNHSRQSPLVSGYTLETLS